MFFVFSDVWSLEKNITDMNDLPPQSPAQMSSGHDLLLIRRLQKIESLLSGESTRKPSCGKVNQCDYWLEVIKWLISMTSSWCREFWRKTYGYWKRGKKEREGGNDEKIRGLGRKPETTNKSTINVISQPNKHVSTYTERFNLIYRFRWIKVVRMHASILSLCFIDIL